MRRPASVAHRSDLVIKRLPVAGQHMLASNDDVDLVRALIHRICDLGQPQWQRRQPGGKAGGDRGDGDARPFQRAHGRGHHRRIDADRAHGDRCNAQRLQQIAADRLARLGA
jgi:hypothetical protein